MGLIAFLLTSFLKICLGGGVLFHTPLPLTPLCASLNRSVSGVQGWFKNYSILSLFFLEMYHFLSLIAPTASNTGVRGLQDSLISTTVQSAWCDHFGTHWQTDTINRLMIISDLALNKSWEWKSNLGLAIGTRLFFWKPFFWIFVQNRSTNGLGAPGLHFFNFLLLS